MATRLGSNVSFEVEGLEAILDGLTANGYRLVGGVGEYDNLSSVASMRGPEGIIVMHGDPTEEVSAAWAIKGAGPPPGEELQRRAGTHRADAPPLLRRRRKIEEADRLHATIESWWPQIENPDHHGSDQCPHRGRNTSIKHIKRTGRGHRNGQNYPGPYPPASAATTAT